MHMCRDQAKCDTTLRVLYFYPYPGPARPLGELGDRLGHQPLRGAKKATEKEKGTCYTPQDPSDWGGEGAANEGFA